MRLTGLFFGSSVRTGALALMGVVQACSGHAEELKLGGTGNALGTMRLMALAYNAKNPGTQVSILSSLGSSGAIKAVPKGGIDIGVSSRQLTEAERATGILETEYARTPLVLAVATQSKATRISSAQIADIYSGKLTHWPDGGLIRPVLRQPADENTKQLKSLSPLIEQAVTAADTRDGMAFAFTDQEAADKMERIAGSIGLTTLALIKSEDRSLRALQLDAIDPTVNNGASGKYPLVKRFYFVTPQTPTAAVQKFMAFVSSPAGRKILLQNGHWIP